ncbi:hypothetical protein BST61_g39 [Cercospora zeina]
MVFSNEPFKVQRPAIPTPLEAAQHTFKVGLDDFEPLGQAIFKAMLELSLDSNIKITNQVDLVNGTSTRSVLFFRELNRTVIPWRSLRISHVIQSSDMSILEAQLHLHEEGAKRVFGAGSSDALQLNSNAGRFRMLDQIRTRVLTINSRIESTQVFILVPSYVSIERSKYSVFWRMYCREMLWAPAIYGP